MCGILDVFTILCIVSLDFASRLRDTDKSSIQSLTVSARHCDPFSQNGILQVSPDDPWNNKWLTLGGRCENSDVLTPTLQASWSLQRPSVTPLFYDGIEAVDADSGPDVRALEGKTVVLIGDSLTRGNTFQFCSVRSPFLFAHGSY